MALSGGVLRAQTYSLAGNWTSASDLASNVWSYGTFSSGTVFVVPSTATNNGSTSLNTWNFPPSGTGADPNIEKNLGSKDDLSSNVDFRPGTVSFGPFQGPAIAQFAAPSAGLYNISATFQTDQIRGNSMGDGTTASVYIGNTGTYAQVLADPGSAQFGTAVTYTAGNVALLAGETVDFAVGGGSFTTQVDATLSVVPEPPAWALAMAGFGFPAVITRRRSQIRTA